MYGDQFGEFVCGYWSLKGKNVHMTVYNYLHQLFLTEQIIEDINLIIFYNASYLINNKVGR